MSRCSTPTENSDPSAKGCALLAPTPVTGRSWYSAFPIGLRRCVAPCEPVPKASSPKLFQANKIIDGITGAAKGDRVVLTQRSQHAQIDEALRWLGRDIGLTERESELLSLLSTGMTNRELGSHLYVSENTIKTQLRHLYAKLDVRNRAQAASVAEQGILGDHDRQTKPVD